MAYFNRQKLATLIKTTLKSSQWAEILKARGWSGYFAAANEFSAFVMSEQTRVHEIRTSLGFAK